MSKEKIYQVPGPLKQKALLNNEEYEKMYEESLNDPEKFWSKQASSYLEWFSSWHTVSKSNFHKGEFSWFEGGKINASTNCIDRHLKKKSKETAIIWEGDDPSLSKEISYQELHEYVCKLANALKKRGVKKGDRVCIYMPMIPEAAFSMLACARIGAIHSVVFGGFSPESLIDLYEIYQKSIGIDYVSLMRLGFLMDISRDTGGAGFGRVEWHLVSICL